MTLLEIALEHGLEIGHGGGGLAARLLNLRALDQACDVVRRARQHRIEIGEGEIAIALGLVDRRARAVERAVARTERDGAVKVGERAAIVGLRQMNLGALGIGQRVLGIALDRLVEIGEGAVVLLLACVGGATQRQAGGAAGAGLEDRLGIAQRAVGVAVLEMQRAAQFDEVGFRRQLDGAADVGEGAFTVAFLVVGMGAQGIGRGAVLIGGDGAIIGCDRLVEIVLHRPNRGLRRVGGDVLWIEPRRLGVVGERAVEITAVLLGAGARRVIRRAGVKLQRVVEIGKGMSVVALAQIELAAAGVEAGAGGAEFDCRLVVLERAVDIAEVAPHGGAVDVRRRRLGIELDRHVVVGDSLPVIAARIPGIAAVLVGGREIRGERDRLVEVGDGVGNVAAVEIGEPAQVVGDAFLLAFEAARLEHPRAGGDALVGELLGLVGAEFCFVRLRLGAANGQDGGQRRERCSRQQPGCLRPLHEASPLRSNRAENM